MTQIKMKIINKLLSKYENSVLSKQGSKLNIKIRFKVKSLFPRYDHSDYYSKRLEIDKAINELLESNFISVTFLYDDFEYIILNIDSIDRLYELSEKENIRKVRDDMLSQLNHYSFDGWIESFRLDMVSKLENYASVSRYIDERYINFTFECLLALQNQKEEISFRKFSQKHFNDSKFLEKHSSKIIAIINDYYTGIIEEDVFETFNVLKNPRFLYLKGNAVISLNGQQIDLGKLNSPFSLMTRDIEQLKILNITSRYVMSVENLTTFYEMNTCEGLIVYLGGFHNHLRGELLLKIYQANNNIPYYHFGDIDAGGFNIFLHLKEDTKIPFKSYLMDLDTLIKYEEFTKSLSNNDEMRLLKLKGVIHSDLIDYMLSHNVKLEQEIIDFDEKVLLENIGYK